MDPLSIMEMIMLASFTSETMYNGQDNAFENSILKVTPFCTGGIGMYFMSH